MRLLGAALSPMSTGLVVILTLASPVICFRKYSKEDVLRLREEVREMFQHAYDGYLTHASNYDELRPLSCDGVDTWGSYSLTLIDALDTLAVMGNYSEFRRVVGILTERNDFNSDINVSVFETNIRIVGGLLGAHLMSRRAGVELEPGWPCNGPLLRLAEDVARRLLPAFDTKTGMPYGTVNLKYGVPSDETPVTCTAGVGTFIVEFGALSRLTGDPIYEEVALNALYALWRHRSPIGLFGNHIDVQTGRWTAQDAGIGAGVDSYYEYLVKGALMLNRPELLEMFHIGRESIDKYLKRDDWHVWVSMNKGQVTLPVFQSLEAYWPGVLSLIGDIGPAKKILQNYHSVWKQYGFLPEFYNIPSGEAGANRENYPLRPELIESAMYLYRATRDSYFLEVGEDMLRSIQYSAKTSCGYATIKNVRDHRKEDRMESFFLAETTKYLYLLFDPDNFLHNDGRHGTVHETPNGMCIIEGGGYIFNTEAHPIDPSALRCCHDNHDWFADFNVEKFLGDELQRKDDLDVNFEDLPKLPHIENLTIELETTIDNLNRDAVIAEVIGRLKNTGNESGEKEKLEIVVEVESNEEELSEIEIEKQRILNEALHTEILLKRIIGNMEKDHLIKKMKTMDEELVNSTFRFAKAVQLYLKENNTTVKAIQENYHLLSDETATSLELIEIMMETYQIYAQDQLILNTLKAILALHQKQIRIKSESIVNPAFEVLVALKGGQDVAKLKSKNPELVEMYLGAQNEYEKYMAAKNIGIDLLSYVSIFQGVEEISGYDIVKIASIMETMRNKNDQFMEMSSKESPFKFELFQSVYGVLFLFVQSKKEPRSTFIEKLSKLLDSDLDLTVDNVLESQFAEQKAPDKTDDIIVIDTTASTTASSIVASDSDHQDTSSESHADSAASVESVIFDADQDIGVGSVEPIVLNTEIKDETNENVQEDDSSNKAPVQMKPPTNVEDTSIDSVLMDFMQSILRSAVPHKPKFEPQLFLEKIRANGIYNDQPQNFKLLTCHAQPFSQRLSINGEFF